MGLKHSAVWASLQVLQGSPWTSQKYITPALKIHVILPIVLGNPVSLHILPFFFLRGVQYSIQAATLREWKKPTQHRQTDQLEILHISAQLWPWNVLGFFFKLGIDTKTEVFSYNFELYLHRILLPPNKSHLLKFTVKAYYVWKSTLQSRWQHVWIGLWNSCWMKRKLFGTWLPLLMKQRWKEIFSPY